jgi:hypothetical protein
MVEQNYFRLQDVAKAARRSVLDCTQDQAAMRDRFGYSGGQSPLLSRTARIIIHTTLSRRIIIVAAQHVLPRMPWEMLKIPLPLIFQLAAARVQERSWPVFPNPAPDVKR